LKEKSEEDETNGGRKALLSYKGCQNRMRDSQACAPKSGAGSRLTKDRVRVSGNICFAVSCPYDESLVIAGSLQSQYIALVQNWIWERRHIMSDLLQVTDESFDTEIMNSDLPAMVDFWAEWCGPCKMVAPVVEELANDYKGKLKVAQMDVDKNRQTPARFGIRNIPTLILFKGGEVAQMIIGAQPKSYIEGELKKIL
jgi:thioredoxin 1